MSTTVATREVIPELSHEDEVYIVDKSNTLKSENGEGHKCTLGQLLGTVLTRDLSESRASVSTDRGHRLRSAGSDPVNYTVTHGVHAAGDRIDLCMGSAGLLALVEGSDVTINFVAGKGLKLAGIHAYATLICDETGETDFFSLVGEVVA